MKCDGLFSAKYQPTETTGSSLKFYKVKISVKLNYYGYFRYLY